MAIRHIISFVVLTPLFFGLAGILLGAVLMPFFRRTGVAMVLFFASALWFFSLAPVSSYLLSSLQEDLPTMPSPAYQVDYLAVLGSAHLENSEQSPHLNLDYAALTRLLKGVELLEKQETASLWLGGCRQNTTATSHHDMLYAAAVNLGADPERIVHSKAGCNTRAEVLALRQEVPPGADIVIISSDFHLKRVSVWAEHYELLPLYIPAVARGESGEGRLGVESFLPSAKYLNDSAIAWHEYFGIVHARLSILAEDWFGIRV